jgi:hypothetical protein
MSSSIIPLLPSSSSMLWSEGTFISLTFTGEEDDSGGRTLALFSSSASPSKDMIFWYSHICGCLRLTHAAARNGLGNVAQNVFINTTPSVPPRSPQSITIMNYAMLADVYSAIPTSPGLVEDSRRKRGSANHPRGGKTTSNKQPDTSTAPPKMNLHTQSNTVPEDDNEEPQRTVVVDDYNDEYDISNSNASSFDVFYPHPQHHASSSPMLFDKEDDILDIVLFIIAGLMFIILLDQVFQMGVSVGRATLKFT